MDQKDTTRERRERQAAATAAYKALSALKSIAARVAHELQTAVIDDATVPAPLIREVHDALLEGLMDKRVKSAEIERKKLFGIPLEPDVPAKSEMRALVRRFELAFMRARMVHPPTSHQT
jgi:hypothetical protein